MCGQALTKQTAEAGNRVVSETAKTEVSENGF